MSTICAYHMCIPIHPRYPIDLHRTLTRSSISSHSSVHVSAEQPSLQTALQVFCKPLSQRTPCVSEQVLDRSATSCNGFADSVNNFLLEASTRKQKSVYLGSFHHGTRGFAGKTGTRRQPRNRGHKSDALARLKHKTEEAVADSGAGMNITPLTHRLTNTRPAHIKVQGFQGSSGAPKVIGCLGTLKNTLGYPAASTTLVSVGAQVEGTLDCISFYQDAA